MSTNCPPRRRRLTRSKRVAARIDPVLDLALEIKCEADDDTRANVTVKALRDFIEGKHQREAKLRLGAIPVTQIGRV